MFLVLCLWWWGKRQQTKTMINLLRMLYCVCMCVFGRSSTFTVTCEALTVNVWIVKKNFFLHLSGSGFESGLRHFFYCTPFVRIHAYSMYFSYSTQTQYSTEQHDTTQCDIGNSSNALLFDYHRQSMR